MGVPEIISAIALVFSVIAFIVTFHTNKKLSKQSTRLQLAEFHMDRNAYFEGRLADWGDAFKLFGVDLDAAKKEGISKEQITFMILSLNALASYANSRGISVYEGIKRSSYRRRMLAQKITRRVWTYARPFSSSSYRDVDRYLAETYSENYENIDQV